MSDDGIINKLKLHVRQLLHKFTRTSHMIPIRIMAMVQLLPPVYKHIVTVMHFDSSKYRGNNDYALRNTVNKVRNTGKE